MTNKTLVKDTKTIKKVTIDDKEVAYIQPRIKLSARDHELLIKQVAIEEKRTGIKIVIIPNSVQLVEKPND